MLRVRQWAAQAPAGEVPDRRRMKLRPRCRRGRRPAGGRAMVRKPSHHRRRITAAGRGKIESPPSTRRVNTPPRRRMAKPISESGSGTPRVFLRRPAPRHLSSAAASRRARRRAIRRCRSLCRRRDHSTARWAANVESVIAADGLPVEGRRNQAPQQLLDGRK